MNLKFSSFAIVLLMAAAAHAQGVAPVLQPGNGGIGATSLAAPQLYPLITTPSATPSPLGNWPSPATQDSGVATGRRHHHTITGTATLGEPTTGYSFIPEMSGDIFSLTNSSGWNNSSSGNGGRTGVESVFAVMKRGIIGVYHHTSKKHLGRYVDEFSFRLNEGDVKRHTLQRLDSFIDGVAGKRLTYKALTH